jgi:hypothetical protein
MPRFSMGLLERRRPVLLLTVFALTFTTIAFAQRDMGTITGTITDAQGGVVPNAKITITEVATGLKYEVLSGTDGTYIRPALKPGTYSITAEAKGFRRVEQQNIIITGGDRVGVNLTLTVGDVSPGGRSEPPRRRCCKPRAPRSADLNAKAWRSAAWAGSGSSASWRAFLRAF